MSSLILKLIFNNIQFRSLLLKSSGSYTKKIMNIQFVFILKKYVYFGMRIFLNVNSCMMGYLKANEADSLIWRLSTLASGF